MQGTDYDIVCGGAAWDRATAGLIKMFYLSMGESIPYGYRSFGRLVYLPILPSG